MGMSTGASVALGALEQAHGLLVQLPCPCAAGLAAVPTWGVAALASLTLNHSHKWLTVSSPTLPHKALTLTMVETDPQILG